MHVSAQALPVALFALSCLNPFLILLTRCSCVGFEMLLLSTHTALSCMLFNQAFGMYLMQCCNRDWVYPLFQSYERIRKKNKFFDNMDLVGSIHTQLLAEGYKGIPLLAIFRDEVSLTLKCCCQPCYASLALDETCWDAVFHCEAPVVWNSPDPPWQLSRGGRDEQVR